MKLHISPDEMGKMYFYDIMLLYNKYEAYVKEENERQQEEQKKYEEQQNDSQYKYNDMTSQISQVTQKMGSLNPGTLTSGFNFPH